MGRPSPGAAEGRPNVLFLAADDLRPALGCYGDVLARTPHIDALARSGMVFERAYCQDAVCSPSRSSLLTGLRPDATGVFNNHVHFRRQNPEVVTLPQHFKNQGYHTQSLGKIFHSSFQDAYVGETLDDPRSWSVPSWFPHVRYYYTPGGITVAREIFGREPNCRLSDEEDICIHNQTQPVTPTSITDLEDERLDEWTRHFVQGLITESPVVGDDTLYDGALADKAIETLRQIKGKTFFLAVGFLRPHLPYVAPRNYWELYRPEQFKAAENDSLPDGAPSVALPDYHENRAYVGAPAQGALEKDLARHLIHGYYASVSFIDAQIGRILQELDRLDLARDTIVVFWGDHGFHLGEQGHWGKGTNFEMATRVPLILRVPGRTSGSTTRALVELVDLYPSLAQLAGLPLPGHLQGTSFAPLLQDPGRTWKKAVFSQYPRPVRPHHNPPRPQDLMGYTMRTDRYRFTTWNKVLDPDQVFARELYDHQTDPMETTNLANDPAQSQLVSRLSRQMRSGWKNALP